MNEYWTPLEIDPAAAEVEASRDGLLGYLAGLDVGALLAQEKALVFRGFGITPDGLGEVFDALLPDRLAYVHGNSPRTKVGDNLYTSTEYPPEYTISMHNELSYSHAWPSRLAFYCQQAPETGGATPLTDGVRWLAALDPDLREAFSGGVRYRQNLHGGRGLGKSWQSTFETEDRDEVEEFLRGTESTWEWKGDGGLRVEQIRPATHRHPVTGAEVWFNQADQWHPAGLGDETAAALARIMPAEDLPQSVTLADGAPIPGDWAVQIRDRGLAAAVDVEWHTGDLMVIDNVLVGHGRRPFTGPRRVLVAMSQ
ncbi:TauD/TfdA family dioxygenase [Amycolatopsis sp. YIM 10]|uniref:TauD/TfdA family dioxygenase n=1 Tax=Amycolatopsis sp. YIM 10 TaxID=2653857 RepID=UPI0012903329|nr:TauD/TfdA family dioxygenase [Amycolatopsis sp. YIM 10]QFU91622.1 Taurine catabolism dioxygenase TauD, TfdA family [Amycolatopsis sp. YIM 10]